MGPARHRPAWVRSHMPRNEWKRSTLSGGQRHRVSYTACASAASRNGKTEASAAGAAGSADSATGSPQTATSVRTARRVFIILRLRPNVLAYLRADQINASEASDPKTARLLRRTLLSF